MLCNLVALGITMTSDPLQRNVTEYRSIFFIGRAKQFCFDISFKFIGSKFHINWIERKNIIRCGEIRSAKWVGPVNMVVRRVDLGSSWQPGKFAHHNLNLISFHLKFSFCLISSAPSMVVVHFFANYYRHDNQKDLLYMTCLWSKTGPSRLSRNEHILPSPPLPALVGGGKREEASGHPPIIDLTNRLPEAGAPSLGKIGRMASMKGLFDGRG